MKIDWKAKLTSRKFWAAIVAVVTCVCVIFGVDELTTEQVTALIMAVGALIAYILGEGFVDAQRAKNQTEEKDDERNQKTTAQLFYDAVPAYGFLACHGICR